MEPGLYKTIFSPWRGYKDHRLGREPSYLPRRNLRDHATAKCQHQQDVWVHGPPQQVTQGRCVLAILSEHFPGQESMVFIGVLAPALPGPGCSRSAQRALPQDLSRARRCQGDRMSLSCKEFLQVSNAIIHSSIHSFIHHKAFNC